MEVAIIDIGSNNIKLEIHKVDSKGCSELAYADKIAARLGHEVFLTHRLAEENIEFAVQGIAQFSKIIKSFNCKNVIALGTASLRESDNKPFVKRVEKECGISVKVVPGIEEARLVYLGALASTSFKGRTFFLNDIGGGSTEISISNSERIYYIESLELGTVRLKELFEFHHNKNDKHIDYDLVQSYVEKVFTPFSKEIKNFSYEMGMCTGGTARNLVEIIRNSDLKEMKEENGIPILETKSLKEVLRQMKNMSAKEIETFKGIDKQRADIIVHGAILLLYMLESLEINKSLVLKEGLRDGALADFVYKKVNKSIYRERQDTSREMGLKRLSDKYNVEKKHAEQCASLSLRLFDLLESEHRLTPDCKDILYGGALLHDIGSYISYQHHHKHSEYLILNSQLLGFSWKEIKCISLLARYHRKGFPKTSHKNYIDLSEEEKNMI